MKIKAKTIRFCQDKDLEALLESTDLQKQDILGMQAVAKVLPFRTNNYVVEELIDWNNIPDDPIFRLTFPHAGFEILDSLDLRQHMKKFYDIQAKRFQADAERSFAYYALKNNH